MRIPDETIESVRAATDIVDLVAASVPLKKRGKNYVGRCPFHQEKTPSFTVNQEKQMYYCFGCGAGGNVFTFLMESEKISFVEAVRTLAERAGIPLPSATEAEQERASEHDALFAACKFAGLFYHRSLSGTPEGAPALEYLRKRGFTEETIRKFGLGYAPNSWDALLRAARAEQIDAEQLERAGLVVRREDRSGVYDRFRGRVMFPIFSVSSRTIGFGARKFREDDPLAKYINSPETPIYQKSRVLYGLSHAKEAIRSDEFAILVEGYADMISVFQAGVQNVVATSGTALTDEQLELLGRYARSVTLLYDADSAGARATMRGIDLAVAHGFEVRVAELPAGEDPDVFVRTRGLEAFRDLLKRAASFLEFKAQTFSDQGMLDTAEGKTRAVRSIVETLARMPDELKRNFYIQFLAEKYRIYESVLFRELEHRLARERQRTVMEQGPNSRPSAGSAPPDAGAQPKGDAELPAAERDLLAVVLNEGPAMAKFVLQHMNPEELAHPVARGLLHAVQDHRGQEWTVHDILDSLSDAAARRMLGELVFRRHEISKAWSAYGGGPSEPDPWEIAERALVAIRRRQLDRELDETLAQLKAAESRGETLERIHARLTRLQEEKKELGRRRLREEPS
jgi:DNA primase